MWDVISQDQGDEWGHAWSLARDKPYKTFGRARRALADNFAKVDWHPWINLHPLTRAVLVARLSQMQPGQVVEIGTPDYRCQVKIEEIEIEEVPE